MLLGCVAREEINDVISIVVEEMRSTVCSHAGYDAAAGGADRATGWRCRHDHGVSRRRREIATTGPWWWRGLGTGDADGHDGRIR